MGGYNAGYQQQQGGYRPQGSGYPPGTGHPPQQGFGGRPQGPPPGIDPVLWGWFQVSEKMIHYKSFFISHICYWGCIIYGYVQYEI